MFLAIWVAPARGRGPGGVGPPWLQGGKGGAGVWSRPGGGGSTSPAFWGDQCGCLRAAGQGARPLRTRPPPAGVASAAASSPLWLRSCVPGDPLPSLRGTHRPALFALRPLPTATGPGQGRRQQRTIRTEGREVQKVRGALRPSPPS